MALKLFLSNMRVRELETSIKCRLFLKYIKHSKRPGTDLLFVAVFVVCIHMRLECSYGKNFKHISCQSFTFVLIMQ